MSRLRDTVLASLSAIGARSEASFYADVFATLEPERFAFLVMDPRALQAPLLEAFISNARLLSDLELTHIIVLGALDEDQTHVRFQSQKLSRQLSDAGVPCTKLNTATYGLLSEIRKVCADGGVPILEITDTRNRLDLGDLVSKIRPRKVIFLHPGGGLARAGRRIGVINTDHDRAEDFTQTIAQSLFLDIIKRLLREVEADTQYILASPLNLISELFTEKGSGTLIRRGADIRSARTYAEIDRARLEQALESAFGRELRASFWADPVERIWVEANYRAGALVRDVDSLDYLSKFWVRREARGEGLARDMWNAVVTDTPAMFWRSRADNPFNNWYLARADGMQRGETYTTFWVGLDAASARRAIEIAQDLPDDFVRALPEESEE